jgi:hypothetical protein
VPKIRLFGIFSFAIFLAHKSQTRTKHNRLNECGSFLIMNNLCYYRTTIFLII